MRRRWLAFFCGDSAAYPTREEAIARAKRELARKDSWDLEAGEVFVCQITDSAVLVALDSTCTIPPEEDLDYQVVRWELKPVEEGVQDAA